MQQPMDIDPKSPPTHENNKSTTSQPQSNDVTPSSGSSSPVASSISSNHKESPLFDRELANFNAVLASISPAAVRAGVRQNWRKCLLGSSSDESFFIRVLLKRTSDHVISKILENSQERILEVASEHYKDFLDQAMAIRLESISAKDLVAVLARARRLGYDEMDLVEADEMVVPAEKAEPNESSDTDEDGDERLQVEMPEMLEVQSGISKDDWAKERLREFRMDQEHDAPQDSVAAIHQAQGRTKSRSKRKECPTCGATFLQSAGLKYHIDRKVCERQRPTAPLKFWCDLCSKGFTTSGGLTYHKLNNVCKDNDTTPTVTPSAQLQAEEAAKRIAPPRTLTPRTTHEAELYPGASHVRSYPSPRNLQKPTQHYSEFSTSRNPIPLHPSPQYRPHPQPISEARPGVTLTPEQFAEMNAKLDKEERRFESVLRNLPENMTPEDRTTEIKRLKAGSSTRKSIIRREYGVQVRRSKAATANAVRTATGGVDVAVVDTPPSTNGFAAVNRMNVFRAAPTKSSSTPIRDSWEPFQAAPPLSAPDAKRRRTGEVESLGRNTPMYDPLRDVERRRSLDQYPRPNFSNAPLLPLPEPAVKSDNRPTAAQRQNGIIPPSRPPLFSDRSSHTAPQYNSHQPSSHERQHLPTRGFTSVNVDQNGSAMRHSNTSDSASPVLARPEDYSTPPFYVDQERRGHGHPTPNSDTAGTFGVLKSTKMPVRDAQRQWETQDPIRRIINGPLGHAVTDIKSKENPVPASDRYAKGNGSRADEIVEILSDSSSSDSNTSPNNISTSIAANQKVTPASSSLSPSIPPEARQGAGIGGRPAALPATSSQQIPEEGRAKAGKSDEGISSDSDGDSDTSIPARRTPTKSPLHKPREGLSSQARSARHESEGAEVQGKYMARKTGTSGLQGQKLGEKSERYGKENREF